jgi:hypothetical protein
MQDKYPPGRIDVFSDQLQSAETPPESAKNASSSTTPPADNRPKHHGSETRQTAQIWGRAPLATKAKILAMKETQGLSESEVVVNLVHKAQGRFIYSGVDPLRRVERRCGTVATKGGGTLGFSSGLSRCGCQVHRFPCRREHRARLLTEQAFRRRCPVRTGDEKIVNGSKALALAWQIAASKLMAA